MTEKKKLIEVALPLDAINREAGREKSIRHGHPSTLHLWWARRPLVACRAVLFAQLVDDPSAHPDEFPDEDSQDAERQRLFDLMEELTKWDNSHNERVLAAARREINRSFNGSPPRILDPFCGGGSIPLEAQRLGLEAEASDLNPVAALITRALIEIPPRWADEGPLHPEAEQRTTWSGAQGLAEDVRRYGTWMRDEAQNRIGHLYPTADLPGDGDGDVVAWLWARTVTCPNPACRATMPLLNGLAICKRKGKETWLEPQPDPSNQRVDFAIRQGRDWPASGSVARNGARCLACNAAVPLSHVRSEGKAGRMGMQLLSVIAAGNRRRHYLPADPEHEKAAAVDPPDDVPETPLPDRALGFRVQGYGLTSHRDLFTPRQLWTLTTFSDLVGEAREQCVADGASPEYADAVATYLTLSIGRLANRCSTQCFWNPQGEKIEQVFARNALPMVWVFAEANPFSDSSGNFGGQLEYLAKALEAVPASVPAKAGQEDAASGRWAPACVATDPPYYDNVPYAELSDFFYVWLRRAGGNLHPDLFSTLLVPKKQELIAEPNRQGSWEAAAAFFEEGLRRSFERIHEAQVPDAPFTTFYAFRQAETDTDGGRASTGWETMLQGLLDAGLMVTGTWPIRSERVGGLRDLGRNSLASAIVLACRHRPESAGVTDRRGFVAALKAELPQALRRLQQGNVAPVDLAQAAIGPGMAIYSRYAKVIEPSGEPMRVRQALTLINDVLDEVVTEQEGEFDNDTRWAIKWFEQYGFDEAPYGRAEVLATATVTSLPGLEQAGIAIARAGRVRLIDYEELPHDWDPAQEDRVPIWQVALHLVQRLQEHGEASAADLLRTVGGMGEAARDLAYRLYLVCERRSWSRSGLAFNALVAAWPEISRLAGTRPTTSTDAQQESLL